MKHYLFSGLAVIALCLASSAQATDNNYSLIDQISGANSATVDQTATGAGSSNESYVEQSGGTASNLNTAIVNQIAKLHDKNVSNIDQEGAGNTASISQTGHSGNGEVINTSEVYQTGDNNSASVTQSGENNADNGVDPHTGSYISQDGDGNGAIVNQTAVHKGDNISMIDQNSLSGLASGAGNSAMVTQYADNDQGVPAGEDKIDNDSYIYQNGEMNSVYVNQSTTAGTNSSIVRQGDGGTSVGAYANVTQTSN